MAEMVGKVVVEVEKKEIRAQEMYVDCGKLSISVTPDKTKIEIDGKELERVTDFTMSWDCEGGSFVKLSMIVDVRAK